MDPNDEYPRQFAPVIFARCDDEVKDARKWQKRRNATAFAIERIDTWWKAEEYHQNYYAKQGPRDKIWFYALALLVFVTITTGDRYDDYWDLLIFLPIGAFIFDFVERYFIGDGVLRDDLLPYSSPASSSEEEKSGGGFQS